MPLDSILRCMFTQISHIAHIVQVSLSHFQRKEWAQARLLAPQLRPPPPELVLPRAPRQNVVY